MAAKSDPKRRAPASRPGKPGESRRRSATSPSRPAAKPARRPAPDPAQEPEDSTGRGSTRPSQEHLVDPIKRSFAESVEQRSDQRLGFTARRAAILAVVMCVLTLTIAGPVRTYFSQHTEMAQLAASEAALHRQIGELEQRKGQLADPAYIAAQARERLGFVKPGDIPFQVQLPPTAVLEPKREPTVGRHVANEPWYTSLWHTIADAPHLRPDAPVAEPVPAPPNPAPPSG
ncbi:FtsB family cell division protein [Mycobacterium sp.]|uniref:FtsB family cell division protein n=1 Tax=Mycobacterium sp. TaxID=1785 RepID=UPI003A8BE70D